eukprot:COSAG02_NODE_16614_length_1070_cov_2.374871_1_plen_31_part_10
MEFVPFCAAPNFAHSDFPPPELRTASGGKPA